MEISVNSFSNIIRSMYNSGRAMNSKMKFMKDINYVYDKPHDSWHNVAENRRISGIYVRNLTKEALELMLKNMGDNKSFASVSTLDMKMQR